ncbi:MAG: hypothetical protein JOY99_04645 [Sphingomonadaceae bacterium]|nr:hypothetical protein [Sphingomonadaceae bacterium]
MSHSRRAVRRLLFVALLGSVSTAALAADPAAGDSSVDAKIAALQAQLNAIQSEISELRGGAAGSAIPAGTQPPSSAATADNGIFSGSRTATGGAGGSSPTPKGPTPTTAAVAKIDSGHPVIATNDGRFTANLQGIMQFDVADYFQHSAGPIATDLRRGGASTDTARARNLSNGTTFRRARIGISGRAFGDFEYNVLFDFGGSGVEDNGHVQELWLQYSGWKPAHIRVGAFAPFIGLEDAGSTNGMLFLERPASADIARSVAGGDFREGGQIAITQPRWFASAAVTGRLVNTAGSSAVQPYNSALGFVGRAAALPVKTDDAIVHLGLHGSYVAHAANTAGPDAAAGTAISPVTLQERPELRVDGTRLISTGAIDASHVYTAGAEFAAEYRNFFVQGEYERIGIDRRASALDNPHFNGFYVEGSWILTGQRRRYNDGNFAFDGPKIDGSFNPSKGNYGAIELALRYSDIDLNYHQGIRGVALPAGGVRGGDQKILTAGVNWYLNPIARVMFDYQHVKIDRLSPSAASYVTPVGAEIGQSYDTASARFQLAF